MGRPFVVSVAAPDEDDAGQKLKKIRERLGLRYRDVEQASLSIAQRRHNDEFAIALSRLADVENKGVVPTIFRLYSLCAIYRLDLIEVLQWYAVDVSALPADAASLEIEKTHLMGFVPDGHGSAHLPLLLDPGIDLRKTTYLSRLVQRWGTLPLMLLGSIDLKNHRYGFVGSEDRTMYPLIYPGSLVMIDESRRKPTTAAWNTEFERPIYFVEHRDGFACGWCNLEEGQLILQFHPASKAFPQVFQHPAEIDIVGQVTGVAMRLDLPRKRHSRS